MQQGFLRVHEVAERYGVQPETVRRWLRSGKLVGFRPGGEGDWRVGAEALAAFEARAPLVPRTATSGTGKPHG